MKLGFLLFTIISFFVNSSVFSQTGPGGVGNSSNNNLWLRADAGTFSDAGSTPALHTNQIRQWNDQSGNNRNAIQTTSANRPLLHLNAANGMPALRFTGDMFIDGPSLGISSSSGYTYILTFRDTVSNPGGINDGSGDFILDRTSATNELVSLKQVTGANYGFQKRNNSGGGLGGPSSSSSTNTNIKTVQMRRDYNVDYQMFYDAELQTSISETDGNKTPPNPRIGRHATTTNGGIKGYIHEFIVYNFALNSAQTIIVNNYLAAKYGYSLSSNDLYSQDNSTNGNFDYEVAGIGRINSSNIHSDAKGTGMLRILNPTGLGNNEFLMWGHNNGLAEAVNTSDVPSGVAARFERIWRVSERNTNNTANVNVGNIDMRWDLNDLGPITASDLRLLIDSDNDGSFNDETPISGAVHLGGGIYEFAGVSGGTGGIENNRRFTIGTINLNQTALPIELVFFTAQNIDNKLVKLEWQTASETNCDFFTIERSKDGSSWTPILKVNGAGNSLSTINYESFDNNPLNDVSYYRLKQTDYNGNFTYSQTRSIVIGNVNATIKIWPNPSNGILNIQSNELRFSEFKIFNSIGQEVSQNIIYLNQSEKEVMIDISMLKNGIYYFKTPNNSSTFFKY